ncbi:hypothetical protein O181_073704, partial [Austropuccinia psidii MF-1]|nr:hypothetical protein [Austropuccinia psidii MF-1]
MRVGPVVYQGYPCLIFSCIDSRFSANISSLFPFFFDFSRFKNAILASFLQENNDEKNMSLKDKALRISFLLWTFYPCFTLALGEKWVHANIKCGDEYGSYTYDGEPTYQSCTNYRGDVYFCLRPHCSKSSSPQSKEPAHPREEFALFDCIKLFTIKGVVYEGPRVDVIYPTKFKAQNVAGQVVVFGGKDRHGVPFPKGTQYACRWKFAYERNNARP